MQFMWPIFDRPNDVGSAQVNTLTASGKSASVSVALIFAVLLSGDVLGQELVRDDQATLAEGGTACWGRQNCEFPQGKDTYQVDRTGTLTRSGHRGYRREVFRTEDADSLKGAVLSARGNVMAIVVSTTTTSRRAFGGSPRPDDLDRSFRISLHSPKTGWLIKAFDLGAFSPDSISLSSDGDLIFVAGHDLERRSINEVRVYNARSGSRVYNMPVKNPRRVTLGGNGFTDGRSTYTIAASNDAGVRVYNSRDPFSVAEYEIACSSSVAAQGMAIAVAEFDDEATSQGEALAEAVAAELKRRGFSTIERSRLRDILEEIQLSTSGLATDADTLDVGELGVADVLVFGNIGAAGGNINVSMRSVVVETGETRSTCTLICRDCASRDLYEGIIKLAEHWGGD